MAAYSFVDNLFTFGSSPANAVEVFEKVEAALKNHWCLSISDDSKEVLACNNSPFPPVSDERWKPVQKLQALGHILDSDGGIQSDFTETRKHMWAAFFRSHGRSMRMTDINPQQRFLTSCIKSIAAAK